MNDPQRAQQIWSVLVERATDQKVIGYRTLDRLTGLVARGQGDALGDVCYYCKQQKLPLLNMLAISQDDGNPSPEFLQGLDVAVEHRKVFAYDWSKVEAPSESDFQNAREWYEQKHTAAVTR